MILQNLGPLERVLRLILSLVMFYFLYHRGLSDVFDWLLLVVAVFLLLNAISARCYLWSWLGISTCEPKEERPPG